MVTTVYLVNLVAAHADIHLTFFSWAANISLGFLDIEAGEMPHQTVYEPVNDAMASKIGDSGDT